MNFLEKIGTGLSSAVDMIVDKNRQMAQLNRLNMIIKNETEVISRSYIALGKQYYQILENTAQETDVQILIDTIKNSELRLKKAKARYDYVKQFGLLKPASYAEEVPSEKEKPIEEEPDSAEEKETFDEDDITIAYADEPVIEIVNEVPAETKTEPVVTEKEEVFSEPAPAEEKKLEQEETATIAQKAVEAVTALKKRREAKKKSVDIDSEAASESENKD